MTQLTDIAWSRQLAGSSRGQKLLWTTAALVMFTAHTGAAWWVMNHRAEETIQIAGSVAIEVDLAALGFAEADQSAAGEFAEAVEPVETAEAVEVEVAEAVPVDRPEPVEPVQEVAKPIPVEAVEPVRAETTPVIPDLVEGPSDVEIATATPVTPETITEAAPVETVEAEPVEEEVEVAAIVHVPVPTARPEYTPPAKPRRVEAPKPEKPTRQVRQAFAGSAGQNQADAKKGIAQGSRQGTATNESAGNQRRSEAGNAAVSNYPGQVANKLRRAVRPQRGRDRGQVTVSFTVGKGGHVSGLRVARGSGSPQLDQAALDTVNRAAPFPPIPDAAGRNSWNFNLPIAFSR